MKFSNLRGYPQALVDAIANDPYSKGDADFSITELLKPPRQRALQIKHAHEIEEDIEDRLWALYGQVAHLVLERANRKDFAERRLFVRLISKGIGLTISGQIDTLCLERGILSDYKFTTSYGFMANEPPKPEWIAQLNMQAYLLYKNGFRYPKHLEIIGLLRDHQKSKAKEDPNYPQTPIARHDIPIWETKETEKFIFDRTNAHTNAMQKLPLCAAEERWAKPDSWAVIRKGQKKAVRVFYTEGEAKEFANSNNLHIEHRPSEPGGKRCASYCNVSKFCRQYQQFKITQNIRSGNGEQAKEFT